VWPGWPGGGRDGMDKTVYRAGWKEQLDREL
jgi:hypothetical protein